MWLKNTTDRSATHMIWSRRRKHLIGQYFKEECDADFVFVTHYPSKKRPFYAMDDPADTTYTLSFDLLFHGLEITTGGQRIHDYNELLMDKIEKRGMTAGGHGAVPERLSNTACRLTVDWASAWNVLTMQLLGEENVRETTLVPKGSEPSGTVTDPTGQKSYCRVV